MLTPPEVDLGSFVGEDKEFEVTFRGEKIKGTYRPDIFTADSSNTEAAMMASQQRSREFVGQLAAQIEVAERKAQQTGGGAGSGVSASFTRDWELLNVNAMDWTKVLSEFLRPDPKSFATYTKVNNRFVSRGSFVTSTVKDNTLPTIKGLRFCVDTSGSLTPRALDYIYSQIAFLMTNAKTTTGKPIRVEAEIIYWNDHVANTGCFDNGVKDGRQTKKGENSCLSQMRRIRTGEGGGTVVKCMFDYLCGLQAAPQVKKGKDKAEVGFINCDATDIPLVIVFTDGEFSDMDFGKYSYVPRSILEKVEDGRISPADAQNKAKQLAQIFKKNFYWVITDAHPSRVFNPPFGKVLGIDFSKF